MKHKNLKDAMKAAKSTGKPQQLEPQTTESVKVNISMRLDLDVLNWLKKEADNQGLPYTTLANSILKKASKEEPIEARIERLEKAILSKKQMEKAV